MRGPADTYTALPRKRFSSVPSMFDSLGCAQHASESGGWVTAFKNHLIPLTLWINRCSAHRGLSSVKEGTPFLDLPVHARGYLRTRKVSALPNSQRRDRAPCGRVPAHAISAPVPFPYEAVNPTRHARPPGCAWLRAAARLWGLTASPLRTTGIHAVKAKSALTAICYESRLDG